MDTYKCKGKLVDKNTITREIFNMLLNYPYENEDVICRKLRIDYRYIHDLILDGIILYIRENPRISIPSVCHTLKIRPSYIAELIESERLVMKELSIEELENELKGEIEAAEFSNKMRNDQELANELRNSIVEDLNKTKTQPSAGFHIFK